MVRHTNAQPKEGAEDWVARLADEVIAAADRRGDAKIVCASGLSPSGPIHLGNLREVMVPHLVADEIARRGREVEHIISWDDYDRFRKVPAAIEGIEEWNQHIGKPLTAVPAPPGSEHPSWAEHFKAAMKASLAELGVEYRGISQTEMYTSGAYVDDVLRAIDARRQIDKILDQYRTKPGSPVSGNGDKAGSPVADGGAGIGAPGVEPMTAEEVAEAAAAEGSGAADEDDGSETKVGYFPYKPFCTECGKDFTTVTAYDDATADLEYDCTCGHHGSMNLRRDFHGKLVWKVDWPMRWKHEGVHFEPSGVDHQSPGSSWQVGAEIAPAVFGGERPIGPMYAFVGIAGMSKMSSSKGGVPTPADALAIMEPQLVRWLYARRRPNQSFTIAFDAEIQRMYDEWDALVRKCGTDAALPGDRAMLARASGTARGELPGTPRPLPYRALASAADITGGNEEQMLRIIRGLDPQVTSLDETRPRLDKATTWMLRHVPASERTQVLESADATALEKLTDAEKEQVTLLLKHLEDDWSLDGLTTLAYGVPKLQAGLPIGEKKLPPEVKAAQRSFFALLYRLLVGAETGPRIPTLLLCLGADKVRSLLTA